MIRKRFCRALILFLSGICCFYFVSSAEAAEFIKLSQILQETATGTRPDDVDYYLTLWAEPDGGVKIPDTACIDRSVWSFARRFIGIKQSAVAMLTAKIKPSNFPSQSLTVPIFVTLASEVDNSGKGSGCQTSFWGRQLSFSFNSNLNPTFDLDLQFHFANETKVAAVTNILTLASQLMTKIGSASGTPAALATTLADPLIHDLSTRLDAALAANFTTNYDLLVSKQLPSSLVGNKPGYIDKIVFSMPTIQTSEGGVSVGTWGLGGSIFIKYDREKFKSRGTWMDVNSIMVKPIVPSETASAQSSLYKILLNGDAVGGFNLSTLKSATNQESLSDACVKLRQFLASFLIPEDALVASFAVLKNTVYDRRPELREDSGCLSEYELETLKTKMGSQFVFANRGREKPNRDEMIEARMRPIRTALLSQNPALIQKNVADPIDNFDMVFGKKKEDYFVGNSAVAKLAETPMQLACYQGLPKNDLSVIAAVVHYGEKKTGAIVSFDEKGKLVSLVLMPAQLVADDLGIEKVKWLDPNKKGCIVDE